MRAMLMTVVEATRAVRLPRLIVLLLAAMLAGVAADFFRGDLRLVFPRPLPAFTPLPSAR